ncbi:hypothetical protein PENSPDRAFT_646121 [Peniophora sp. CONT]|nr:hypothetical protein PENSPDRAFT_646121 [Peniophora sp. CONT]
MCIKSQALCTTLLCLRKITTILTTPHTHTWRSFGFGTSSTTSGFAHAAVEHHDRLNKHVYEWLAELGAGIYFRAVANRTASSPLRGQALAMIIFAIASFPSANSNQRLPP